MQHRKIAEPRGYPGQVLQVSFLFYKAYEFHADEGGGGLDTYQNIKNDVGYSSNVVGNHISRSCGNDIGIGPAKTNLLQSDAIII